MTTKQKLDGLNVWQGIISNSTSPRHEMLISLTPPHYPTPEKPHAQTFVGELLLSAVLVIDTGIAILLP